MAHTETIARPYAKAILAQAATAEEQERWQVFLQAFSAMLSDPSMRRHLADSSVVTTLGGWLDEWLKKNRKQAISGQEQNFLRLIVKHDRLSAVPAIAMLYEKLLFQSKNICLASVTSAKPLQDGELAQIQKALVKKTGKAVELSTHVDETLLAGVYIEYDGQVIDQTMKGRIARFAHSLVD